MSTRKSGTGCGGLNVSAAALRAISATLSKPKRASAAAAVFPENKKNASKENPAALGAISKNLMGVLRADRAKNGVYKTEQSTCQTFIKCHRCFLGVIAGNSPT